MDKVVRQALQTPYGGGTSGSSWPLGKPSELPAYHPRWTLFLLGHMAALEHAEGAVMLACGTRRRRCREGNERRAMTLDALSVLALVALVALVAPGAARCATQECSVVDAGDQPSPPAVKYGGIMTLSMRFTAACWRG